MMRLKTYSQPSSDRTGYALHNHQRVLKYLHKLKDHSIVLASNSPVFHVQRVINRLGLARLPVAGIMTPGDPYQANYLSLNPCII